MKAAGIRKKSSRVTSLYERLKGLTTVDPDTSRDLIRMRETEGGQMSAKCIRRFERHIDPMLEPHAWNWVHHMIDKVFAQPKAWEQHVLEGSIHVNFVISKAQHREPFLTLIERIVAETENNNTRRGAMSDIHLWQWLVKLLVVFYHHAPPPKPSQHLFTVVYRYQEILFNVNHAEHSIPLEFCIDYISFFVPMDADIALNISRNQLLKSSWQAVLKYRHEDWEACETIHVSYVEDSGVGIGVAKDWLNAVAFELFYGTTMFSPCPEEPSLVHPRKASTDEEVVLYEFAGCILGLSIKLRINIGVHLSSSALLMMTGRGVGLEEMRQLDPVVHQSLVAVSQASFEEFEQMGLDQGFVSVSSGSDLFPHGHAVEVTHEARHPFATLAARYEQHEAYTSCRSMMSGVMRILHNQDAYQTLASLAAMTPAAMNAVIGGQGLGRVIDVQGWRKNTTVQGDETVALWFFEMIDDMCNERRSSLLRFWTGLRCLPWNGFRGLEGMMNLTITDGDPKRLPTSRTCMMLLNIPAYATQETLRERFTLALSDVSMDND